MKVFKVFSIVNKDGEEFLIKSKSLFCQKHNLTRRLLDYTFTGERTHHKGYTIVDKFFFTEKEDGDIVLDDGIRGVIVDDAETNERDIVDNSSEEDVLTELIKSKKDIQILQDKLRVTRKLVRQQNREEYVADDLAEEIANTLKNKMYPLCKKVDFKETNNDKSLLIQLSDLHFGKYVNLPMNKFDFDVAEERLNKYLDVIKDYIDKFEITSINVAFTGDIFNLDSHFDSLLTNQENRAKSFVRGIDIMIEFFRKLSSISKDLKVVGIIGNESRIRTTEYQSNVDTIASNSFDYILYQTLKRLFGEDIFSNNCDSLNYLLKINNKNIVLTHGDKFKHRKEDISEYRNRMIEMFDDKVDYVIFGHIHETMITPNYARSGSLVGIDEYASNGLNISRSVASQNMYLIDDKITCIEVKL